LNWKLAALILGAIAVVIGAILAAGTSPGEAVRTLYQGSLGSPGAINGTLRETTPLLIAGLAVFLALRAGLFNIGVEGQLIVGAMSCAFLALKFPGPAGMALGVIGGVASGALWALPAGLIKAYRGGHEVITTIMLNNIAFFFTSAMVAGPLRDPSQESTTTASISGRLPLVFSNPPLEISSALLVAILLIIAASFWLKRFVTGYELQLVGANPRAASLAGVSTPRVAVGAMSASGALAGLAGAVQVLAYQGRFYEGFSPGYGFDALGVALLAGGSALGVIPAALLFGILTKGAASLQAFIQLPKGITLVILGLLIICFAAFRYRRIPVIT
jgi:general nucleoside transport system permease protein